MMRPTKRRLSSHTYAVFIRALLDDPLTQAELEEVTGLGAVAIRHYLKALRELKLVRVSGVLPDKMGRRTIEQFRFEPDKPDYQFVPKSPAKRSRDYRAASKQRALQEAWRQAA
jgi:hypothetical protein